MGAPSGRWGARRLHCTFRLTPGFACCRLHSCFHETGAIPVRRCNPTGGRGFRAQRSVLAPLAIVVLALASGTVAPVAGQVVDTPPLASCPLDVPGALVRPDEPPVMTLRELWEAGRVREPGYAAAEARVAAGDADRSAVRRELLPGFRLDGLGNYGQRLSPGEERVLGVGARGELRLVSTWTLLEGGRGWRGTAAELRRDMARLDASSYDDGYRAALAELYVEAATAEAAWLVTVEQRRLLDSLAVRVRQRLAAGVDVVWEGHLLDEGVARADRRVADAAQARDAARVELAVIAGACVRPGAIEPVPGRPAGDPADSPYLQARLAGAAAAAADARAHGRAQAWRLDLHGIMGPTRSRAFANGPVENEYLVGVGASFNPDLAGVRRQQAAAGLARARALQADTESELRALRREVEQLGVVLEHAGARREILDREVEQGRRRLNTAVARWEAGVDRWAEVANAYDRVVESWLLAQALTREIGLAHVRHALLAGQVDDLADRLGQEDS
jgi:outer membrane protein TolC